MGVDIQTLILVSSIINVLNTFILGLLWWRYQKHYHGLSLLFLSAILHTLGHTLSYMREILPSFVALVISNTLIVAGLLVMCIGLERFYNVKKRHIIDFVLIAGFIILMSIFSLYFPNLYARVILVTFAAGMILIKACWLLAKEIYPELKASARLTLLVLTVYAVLSFVRILILVVRPPDSEIFFESGFDNSMAVLVQVLLSVLLTVGFVSLVTERLQHSLNSEKNKYRTTFNTTPSALILARRDDGKIFEVNDGYSVLTGDLALHTIGKTIGELDIWCEKQDQEDALQHLAEEEIISERVVCIEGGKGNPVYGILSSRPIDIDGTACSVISISDVSELVHMRQKLQELATHDVLTGLPNRLLFYDRFEFASANADRWGKKFAVLSADMDQLKQVNDNYGHEIGDYVLVQAGVRLQTPLRAVDSVSRFGGDEFVLLLWDIQNDGDLEMVISRIDASISQPILIEGHTIQISMSIGAAIYPDEGINIHQLMKLADIRMYEQKTAKRRQAR